MNQPTHPFPPGDHTAKFNYEGKILTIMHNFEDYQAVKQYGLAWMEKQRYDAKRKNLVAPSTMKGSGI